MRTSNFDDLLSVDEVGFGAPVYSREINADGCSNVDFQVKIEQFPAEPFIAELCVQCSINNLDWATIEDSKITLTEADEGVYFNSERAGASWYRIKAQCTNNRFIIAYTKAKTERPHI